MNRRNFMRIGMAGAGLAAEIGGGAMAATANSPGKARLNVVKAGGGDLQAAMDSGKVTSVSVARADLARIRAID